MNHVHIFDVTHRNGNSQTMNLCPDCAIKRRASKRLDEPVGFNARCDDCVTAEQAAPGYNSPTVDYVATTSDVRPTTARAGPMPLQKDLWSPVLVEGDAA